MDSFDVRESTVSSIHRAIFSGSTTCRQIVEAFIARIEAFNPTLNAIITLNPHALSIADEKDQKIAGGNVSATLFGIPILLKDTYDTIYMPTTGGCLALADTRPSFDAPVVSALKNAGAIILGKTNTHELALGGLTVSSLGGQTLNPYDLTRTPGGSSGGTGAAIAASFATLGTGSDTMNSLRNPASANCLFSIRPTKGLISRTGLMPISSTQDAAGPIGRNIEDLAKALTAMASVGRDQDDNATSVIPDSSLGIDYAANLQDITVTGMRLGLVENFFMHQHSEEITPVNRVFQSIKNTLTKSGINVVSINSDIFDSPAIYKDCDTQCYECNENMTGYLSRPSLQGDYPHSLVEIFSSGKFLVVPDHYDRINKALTSSRKDPEYTKIKARIQQLTESVECIFAKHNLDALIYPEQSKLVDKIGDPAQSHRNGILAAVTGFPVVVVPAGFSTPTADAAIGVPIGMEILGLKWQEAKLLKIAKVLEDLLKVRKMPRSTEASVEVKKMSEVPTIVPDHGNISKNYPLGTLGSG